MISKIIRKFTCAVDFNIIKRRELFASIYIFS